jgi:hypothetical protein
VLRFLGTIFEALVPRALPSFEHFFENRDDLSRESQIGPVLFLCPVSSEGKWKRETIMVQDFRVVVGDLLNNLYHCLNSFEPLSVSGACAIFIFGCECDIGCVPQKTIVDPTREQIHFELVHLLLISTWR